ncbi:MAG: hypothetical protein ACTSPM_02100 [Candidatus Heimdallarchaeota archaeon]
MKTKTIKARIAMISFLLLNFLLLTTALFTSGKTVSDSIVLTPLGEHAVGFRLHDGDTLTITVVMTYGEIELYILDSENYPSMYYYERAYSDISSTFNTEFTALWTDTFYVLFYNSDTANSASLTFTLESDQDFNANLIINLSLGAGLLGAIIVVNFTGKKIK